MAQTNTKYNKTITGLYATQKGGYLSLKINKQTRDALLAAANEEGGKLFIRPIADETKQKFENPDTAPDAFLEIMSADSVAEYAAKREATKNSL